MTLTQIKKQTWIVIPGYNEEKYLATVLKAVKKHTANVVYVDDGSEDKSAQIARRHLDHVLVHDINLGKGGALKTGCDYAFKELGAKYVVFMDADNQHDPAELRLFFTEFKQGAKVVFGERAVDHHMPLIRVIFNRIASFLVLLFFGQYVPDIPSGYKAFSKNVYQKIRWNAIDYGVELEIAAKVAKFKIPFRTVQISTIYHEFDRGMTVLHTLKLPLYLINLRISL